MTPSIREIFDRAPPHDLAAEAAVNGAAILDPSALPAMIEAGYRSGLMHDPDSRQLAAAILSAYADHGTIDQTLILAALRPHESELAGQNAMALLLRTIDATPHAANWPHHLGIVREQWQKRQTFLIGQRILTASMNGSTAADIASETRQALDDISLAAGDATTRPVGIATLIDDHPHLAEPIIDGILRRGETANIIAAPKVGKSWLGYQLALSVVLGRYWLDTFACRAGRVLLIDNELHAATIAHRIRTSAGAMAISQDEYAAGLDVLSLRGRLVDLHGICRALEAVEPGTYDLVILDALYRAVPIGTSENANASMAALFNLIDQTTARLKCCWCNVHHASKGAQADKSIVDVGAGAGAQSRAADAHLVLREHEERGVVVLDGVVRSFAPVEALPLRWCFPTWQRADGVDPAAIKGRLSRGEQRTNERDAEGIQKIVAALETATEPLTVRRVRALLGCRSERAEKLLAVLERSGRAKSREYLWRGIMVRDYWLASRENEVLAETGTVLVRTTVPVRAETGTGTHPKGVCVPVQSVARAQRRRKKRRTSGRRKTAQSNEADE